MSARLAEDLPTVPDLDDLRGDDEARARDAHGRLWEAARPAVLRMLARRGARPDEAEDAAQDAALKLWRLRRTVRAESRAAWHAVARKAALRAFADRLASRRAEAPLEGDVPDGDLPYGDLPYLDALLALAEGRRLFEAADRLWLGAPREDVPTEIAAVAVQHVLLDGLPPEEAAALLGVAAEDVGRWLDDPATLARALFASLCWPADDLAGYVLRPDRPLSREELNALSGLPGGGRAAPGWTEEEVRVVLWRVREGLDERELLALVGTGGASLVRATLARLREAYPFRAVARALRGSLASRGREGALAAPGLWKRAAVEYHAGQGLPHRQIVERAGPPAEEAPFQLDLPTLNNWLSAGRLYARLAAFAREEGA